MTNASGLQAELVRIDENLIRRELTDAERAWHTSRRKEIYETLHPESVNGANQHSRVRQFGEPSPRFTTSTSQATGRPERSIQREAERGRKLGSALQRIVGELA